MLRESTQSRRSEDEQLAVFGRTFQVRVERPGRLFWASSPGHGLRVFGHCREQALANLHFAIVCLTHLQQARQHTS